MVNVKLLFSVPVGRKKLRPICCGEAICKNETNYVQEENMEMRGDGLVGRSVGLLSFDLLL